MGFLPGHLPPGAVEQVDIDAQHDGVKVGRHQVAGNLPDVAERLL